MFFIMKKYLLYVVCCLLSVDFADAASVVVTVNGVPVTDVDITERVRIMPPDLNNRVQAKNAITDDILKLEYAKTMRIEPAEKDVNDAIKSRPEYSGHADNPQMKMSVRAAIAWQIMVMRSIVPNITVGDDEITQAMNNVERERGLPQDMTFIRLLNIPNTEYAKLVSPKSCDGAEKMARDLGGEPQKIKALEYELAPDVREHFIGLPLLTWSPLKDGQTFLVCNKKKTKEWGKLDDIVKQNAIYDRAFFQADQVLKQLRRKATIVE